MRRTLVIVGALALSAMVIVILWRWRERTEVSFIPEVRQDGPSEVTIAWQTRSAASGRVHFSRIGVDAPTQSAVERADPSRRHEVVLEGLEPSTRYAYWIQGSEPRYHFQTGPLTLAPFSFLLVWGDISGRIGRLTMSESPDFILSLTGIPRPGKDPFREVRPFVPIYGMSGSSSSFLPTGNPGTWSLDWGGLRLVFLTAEADLGRLLHAPAAHTIGLVLRQGSLDIARLKGSKIHGRLVEHNTRFPSRPAAFVIVPGGPAQGTVADGVVYLGVPLRRRERPGSGAARIDVAPESTVAFFFDSGQEVTLRSSGVERRRTCEECRRLADRGAYEKSVRAYEEFIETHEGHYQIDDAHLAIAQILDENLFRFREALVWYRKMVSKYPSSTLVPLARVRIAFLEAHADHGYRPLVRFERIRKTEILRNRGRRPEIMKTLERVRAIIREFPRCSLAPEMHYWLANQYRQPDPDRAAETYRTLIREFPGHSMVKDARLEIGETYYQARRYREAISAYEEALAALPSYAGAIGPQIMRSRRNLRRGRLALGGGGIILLVLAAGLLWPPAGLSGRKALLAGKAFLPLASLTLLGGWLVHEQLSGPEELFGLALAISASACFGFPFSSGLADKLFTIGTAPDRPGRRVLSATVSIVSGLLLLVATTYLAIYLVNEHYLTAFSL